MDKAERYALMVELRRNGATLEHIANRVSLSLQRVWRILRAPQVNSRGQGRPCPKCGGHSRTLRTVTSAKHTIRRHVCRSCAFRWTSRQADQASTI